LLQCLMIEADTFTRQRKSKGTFNKLIGEI